ncbi:SpoIIE family protein phosphatase [Desulfitobacterium hafniense]|uniref:SpoIIE family protein phosphatase n=1 Tax=Desulfitobacterium hafniense TaxID=49338 RepID=UPI00036BDC70|nr:SpoIIE family protein phosphatase [Desulfitobacterium hafniense]
MVRGEVMAEWATLKTKQGLRKEKLTLEGHFWPFLLGLLIARGSILGLYPFGIAFGAALMLHGRKGTMMGLLGVTAGVSSLFLKDLASGLQILLTLLILSLFVPRLRGNKRESLYLGISTALVTGCVALAVLSFGQFEVPLGMKAAVLGILNGGLAVVFWFALRYQDAVWRGNFTREQGMAWLLILIGVLSGLHGVMFKEINFSVVILSFFILFIAQRFGAGAAAGVGAMLGFLPQLEFNPQNLMAAGIYGLAGFGTGAFQKLGKLGLGVAFMSITLMFTVYLQPEVLYSQLLSSGIGLLLFLLFPSTTSQHDFLKDKPMPEVESTVTKVKTVAEIFDQIAYSAQAAEAEVGKSKPEIPELMNVLVERVCKNCPTLDTCWTREFYRTYHLLFNLFEWVEREEEKVNVQNLPVEWKRHCGKLKEMLLGVQFIMEHEKSIESWRSRLTANQEALARQFQSVSQVIGHLAKELNARHNVEQVKPASLARRRKQFLDVGVASFTKKGNSISGDNYASLAFAPTQHAFIVSDGMGVGEGAAKMSSTALNLLEQLLTTGFEPESAIQALNSILVLRSPEESFVTLDIGILDCESDDLKLIKVGACPSYIVREDKVHMFQSSSLPVGILNHVEIPVIEEKLRPDEYLVLVTDGIQDILKDGKDWLKKFLDRQHPQTAQELAEAIVQEARVMSGNDLEDDGIVLVVKKNIFH